MPSEREIRKLYVNGRTICIEFYFAYFKFQRPQDAQPSPKVAILETWGGYPSTSILAGAIRSKYKFQLLSIFCVLYQHFYHPTPLYRIFSLNTRKRPPKGDLFRQAAQNIYMFCIACQSVLL